MKGTWISMLHFDSMSIVCKKIMILFDFVLIQSLMILLIIFSLIISLFFNSFATMEWVEMPMLETLWTLYPSLIILIMVFPSIFVFYQINPELPHLFTLKIIGHQWYWSYDYSSLMNVSFDSYTLPSEMLELGEVRLMDVDNRLILPVNVFIQMLMTSYDVIHSFTLPSVAIKVDCNPAYLNSVKLMFSNTGIYYGLCSEICGSAHSQMSICSEVTSITLFKSWMKSLE